MLIIVINHFEIICWVKIMGKLILYIISKTQNFFKLAKFSLLRYILFDFCPLLNLAILKFRESIDFS